MQLKKRFIVIPVVLISLVAGLYAWQRSTDPGISSTEASKTLEQSLGRSLKEEKQTGTSWQKHSGTYFEIEIPPGAVEYDLNKQNIDQNKNILEHYSFDGYEPRMIFVATVSDADKMQVKTYDDIPAVTMRKNNTNEYKNYLINNSGLAFSKLNTSFEKTAFFIKDKKVYTFSLTAEYQNEKLDQVFDKIIQTLLLK